MFGVEQQKLPLEGSWPPSAKETTESYRSRGEGGDPGGEV